MGKKLKKYKVLVNGQREEKVISVVEPIEYYLPAENKEKAILMAKKKFGRQFPDAQEVKAIINKRQSVVSIIFLSIACFLSFFPWHIPGTSIVISLQPSLFTTLISIILYSSVVIRIKGLKNSFNSVIETAGTMLTIIFVASFTAIFIGETSIPIKLGPFINFTIPISGHLLLLLATLLSWLGIAVIARFVWVALFGLAALRLVAADAAMGIWGMIYIISAFLGIIFQLKQENDSVLQKIGSGFMSATAKAHNIVKIENNYSNIE